MAVKINNIDYRGFFFNGEALTAIYLNGNKVYGGEPQPITITPVEYISNEGLLAKHWIDLNYVWKDNSKVQLGFYSVYTNTRESWQVFGEENEYDANGNIINDNDDIRLFLYDNSVYWDVTNRRVQRSIYLDDTSSGLYNKWRNIELGNNYIKNMDTGKQSTSSTYSISRTKTVGLFGSPKYALSNTDRIRYKYIKIYEGDTLVKDIIPVLDKDGIPCFLDKLSGTFYYYKVNDVPSTGLTYANAYQQLEYLQNTTQWSSGIKLDYVPIETTSAEIDCSGRNSSASKCFGANRENYFSHCFRVRFNGSDTSKLNFDWGNQKIEGTSSALTSRCTIKITPTAGYVNNEKVVDINGTWTSMSTPLCLFMEGIETTTDGSNWYKGKIYGFKVFEGDTLVRNYLPTKIGSTYGVYESVQGKFYASNNNSMNGPVIGNLIVQI